MFFLRYCGILLPSIPFISTPTKAMGLETKKAIEYYIGFHVKPKFIMSFNSKASNRNNPGLSNL